MATVHRAEDTTLTAEAAPEVAQAVPALAVRPIPVTLPENLRMPDSAAAASRLVCVDVLRGAVMILMVLDHVRDFFTGLPFAPEDVTLTSGPLFFTRFVTHFCSPVFFLLAGAGASLSLAQGKSVDQVSRFLWTRGLWLVFVDLTVVSYAWTYVFPFWFSGVLWTLGWSMVALAGLIRLPSWVTGVFGAVLVLTHNLLDDVNPAAFGRFAALWLILHGRGAFWIVPGKSYFFVLWVLIPWVGVMALGYVLGLALSKDDWRKPVFRVGAALAVAFLILRFFHLYGNSDPAISGVAAGSWAIQPTLALTIVSFFDTLKYPPSLQFLLITLGPALMALAWLGKVSTGNWMARALAVFGRVPLFFYVIHLYVIHTLAVYTALIYKQKAAWLLYGATMMIRPPEGYGHGLPFIYAMSLAVVIFLYFPCRWFMRLKERHKDWWWLRYL